MAIFTGKVSTRYVGSEYEFEFEVPDEELEACKNKNEEEMLIYKYAEENMWMQEAIELSYEENN